MLDSLARHWKNMSLAAFTEQYCAQYSNGWTAAKEEVFMNVQSISGRELKVFSNRDVKINGEVRFTVMVSMYDAGEREWTGSSVPRDPALWKT